MYPETLILDTSKWVQLMYQKALVNEDQSALCHTDWFVPDLIQEVMEALRFRHTARDQLGMLFEEVLAGQCASGAGYVPPEFAPLVNELGETMLAQLELAKAYSVTGDLLYQIRNQPEDSPATTDVVLTLTKALPGRSWQLGSQANPAPATQPLMPTELKDIDAILQNHYPRAVFEPRSQNTPIASEAYWSSFGETL